MKITTDTEIEFPYIVTRGNSKVKIYRVKSATSHDGWYYQVADYTKAKDTAGNPKRTLVSFADFAAAKTEAKRIAECLADGEVHALEMRGPERSSYGRAIEILEPTKTPLEVAAMRYAEAVKILGAGDRLVEAAKFFVERQTVCDPTKTVPALLAEFIREKTDWKMSERYIQDLDSRLARFAKSFPGKVMDVTTPQIQEWLSGLRLSRQSYKNYRTVIHGLFAHAESLGYIARRTNPVESVKKPGAIERDVEIFTPQEFTALLDTCLDDYLPSLAIGGFAGLRSAEIQRLEWSDIDLRSRFITVDASKAKTGSRRIVPICDALARWLAKFADSTGSVWRGNSDAFVNAQRRLAKHAGINPDKDGIGQWKGNALRHSYASYRLAETGDAARVANELGNSAAIVHRHYKELVRPEEAKAWFAISPARPANGAQMPALAV